ncbi:molybdopterin synthase sulfurylase MoeB [Pantoea sp. PA1]|jgi:molybdopterin-synthase adenylyltransferase|uniref:molybdopterin-synthase adenylyltransferase MoeB n=1 Tax=Pantoea ananas TaxID=553 RepID=UPI0002F64C0F|nr:molybdopterin-synthase adenylyltransferase MoeB [Pantoea ananatis]MDH0052368.1 molybdopterin-synthase adenylyltransferase MoeB [Pantoea ananatis]MDQ1225172.1 molybdopterin synthase sulfurylase MoeB [Pantoea ananatis]MDR6089688.1 molybdopterin synthase sulfurylase MoeB [Pantoea ananatis]PWV67204.1 adenylyltransferase/sulfurtransferase [Pantoea ananatis]HCN01370.1 molybdopterin-synthase adenylyltransferase MoeB [Pantoea ananatis]
MLPELSHEEMLRYNRQIVLRGFDFDGQERLKASHVLIVGLGGLGCAASPYLAAAGVGNLTLVDFDTVSLSNLQRQILHYDADIGRAKVESARETLAAINPHCQLQAVQGQLDDEALNTLIARQQVVVDCTDNVAVREQINRLCYQLKVPLVSGAAIRMEGQLSVFDWQPDAPCYRCISRLFGAQVLSCVEAGVMAPLVGVVGAMQAMETLKLLTHFGSPARSRLLMYDALSAEFRTLKVAQDPHCEVCGHHD